MLVFSVCEDYDDSPPLYSFKTELFFYSLSLQTAFRNEVTFFMCQHMCLILGCIYVCMPLLYVMYSNDVCTWVYMYEPRIEGKFDY